MESPPDFAFNNKAWSDAVLHVYLESKAATPTRKAGKPPPRRKRKVDAEASRTYHVSKLHLAQKSTYFRRLIDGWTDGNELHLTVASEEDEETLEELLRFMYTGKIQNTTDDKVFRLLRAADQFDTPSCLEYCAQLLAKPPSEMEYSTAVDVLALPEALGDSCEAVQQLFTAARRKVTEEFADLESTMQDEAQRDRLLSLQKAEFKAVIESDELCVLCEESVLLALVQWVHKKYRGSPPIPVVEELAPLVRYAQLPVAELRNAVESTQTTEAHRRWSPCTYHCGYKWQLQLSLYGKGFARKPEKAGQARLFLDRSLQIGHKVHNKLAGPMCTYRFRVKQRTGAQGAAWNCCHMQGHNAAFTDDYSKGCTQVFNNSWDVLLREDNKCVVDGNLHIECTVDIHRDLAAATG